MLETVIPFKVHLDFIFLKRYSLRRAMTINHVFKFIIPYLNYKIDSFQIMIIILRVELKKYIVKQLIFCGCG